MRHILLAVAAFLTAAVCQAQTFYINPDGSGDYPTIQAAINNSNHGDVIILRPGTYIGTGNMEIDCNGKNITIQSTDPDDPAIAASTIIDCQRRGRAIKFVKGETSTLAGLTIINGALLPLPNSKGGTAVFCENSSPTISNCTIRKCYVSSPDYFNSAIRCVKSDVNLLGCTVAEIPDAGIEIRDSNAVIAGCTFSANLEGIYSYDSNMVIADCTISNNRTGIALIGYNIFPPDIPAGPIVNSAEINDSIITANGTGIYCINMNLTIERSNVSDNNIPADSTGISGIALRYCNTLINDCVISRNKSRYSSSIQYDAGGVANISGSLEINNCDVSGNSAIYGGGITNYYGKALIKNCRITNNTAGGNVAGTQYLEGKGGGVYDYEGTQLTIEGCTITGNKTIGYPTAPSAGSGGGISSSNQQIITVKNCIISANKSRNGGGVNARYITIINSVLSHNEAQSGGGIYNNGVVSRFENCTFAANKAVRGGAINGTGIVTNCIFWDEIIPSQSQWYELSGSFSVSYSDIRGGFQGQGEGNIDDDPRFTFASDFHLSPASPCIDAGVNTLPLPDELPAEDLDGNPRVIDGNSDGIATVDMGAYEFNSEISRLAVSNSEFIFSCAKNGPAPEPKVLMIRNCGGGTLNWQISENCPWLNLSAQSGTSNGSASQVILTVDTALLEPGVYNTDMLVTAQDSAGSPRTISVTLRFGRLLNVPQNFKTIQSAIDEANNFDWVIVDDGIYIGPGNRDISFRGKTIMLCSWNGPENCIIDCGGRP